MMSELRKGCNGEVFDYCYLISILQGYKAPHRKITQLLASKSIIRIKKGLYIFGEEYRLAPIHKGLIANLIYGPSYVTAEYALSYYGVIPERVDIVTSMTSKRKKRFETPVGGFQYDFIHAKRFSVGLAWAELDDNNHFYLASLEKALVDSVLKHRHITTQTDMKQHLLDNMRIDAESLKEVDMRSLKSIVDCYHLPVVTLLYKTIGKL